MEDNVIQQKLFLKKFKGSGKPGNTLSYSISEEHLYLNNRNENLKILTNINLDYQNPESTSKKIKEYSGEIPISVKDKIIQIQGYGKDKVIILTQNNRIKIIKFTTFGFHEVISEIKSITENLDDKLDSLTLCPKRNFIVLLARNNQSKYNKIIVLQLKKVEKIEKEGGFKYKILSLFQTRINFLNPISVHITIPFYYNEMPLLSIAEVGNNNSKIYFYVFDGDGKFTMIKDLDFSDNNRAIALKSKAGVLIKINNLGDVLRLSKN